MNAPRPHHPLLLVVLLLTGLGCALAMLRLDGTIPWPWWLVLLPLVVANALPLGALLFVLAGAFLVEWRSARRRHHQRKRSSYQFHP